MIDVDAALASLRTLIVALVDEALSDRAKRPANDEYLTPEEAADVAGVKPPTIRRWVREGKLPKHAAGNRVRILRSELEEYLRSGPRDRSGLTPEQHAMRDFG